MRDFKGNLSFEVRANLIVPVVAPVSPPVTSSQFTFRDLSSVKRGRNLQINWSGGSSTENVTLELLKDNVSQQTLMNSRNTGAYSWSVPSDMKPGTYQLRITGSSGSAVSSNFAIKHKIPTLVKVLPIVVIAGVLAMTKRNKESEDDKFNRLVSNKDAILVKMCDLRHNMDIRRLKGITEKDLKRIDNYCKLYTKLKEIG